MQMKTIKEKLQAIIDLFGFLANITGLKLVFQVDGIHMWAYDPSHSAMLFVILKKNAFNEYDPSFSEKCRGDLELVIDLEKIRDYLKLYKKNDMISLSYDLEKNRLVAVQGQLTRTFGLIDPEGYPEFKLPALHLKKMLQLPSDIFLGTTDRVMGKAEKKKANGTIGFSITESGLNILDYNKYDEKETSEETIFKEHLIAVTSDDNKQSLYDYEFLRPMANAIKKYVPTITIEFDHQTPIRINGETEDLKILYLQVPMILDEDEKLIREPLQEPKHEEKPVIQEPEVPLEVPVMVEKSGVTAEKQEPEPPRELVIPTKIVKIRKNGSKYEENIGSLAKPRTKTEIIGVIVAVTEKGYLILFKGETSKTLKEPVEIERDLVEIYRRNDNKKGGQKDESKQ